MTRNCVNKACNAQISDEGRFCFICGAEQPLVMQEKKGFFGRKKEANLIPGKIAQPEEYEDFKLSPEARKFQQPVQQKKDDTMERLDRIEEKLDIVMKNHSWLLASVDSWLQGYRQKPKDEESEDTESDK